MKKDGGVGAQRGRRGIAGIGDNIHFGAMRDESLDVIKHAGALANFAKYNHGGAHEKAVQSNKRFHPKPVSGVGNHGELTYCPTA